jgi:hypothetical protein
MWNKCLDVMYQVLPHNSITKEKKLKEKMVTEVSHQD